MQQLGGGPEVTEVTRLSWRSNSRACWTRASRPSGCRGVTTDSGGRRCRGRGTLSAWHSLSPHVGLLVLELGGLGKVGMRPVIDSWHEGEDPSAPQFMHVAVCAEVRDVKALMGGDGVSAD